MQNESVGGINPAAYRENIEEIFPMLTQGVSYACKFPHIFFNTTIPISIVGYTVTSYLSRKITFRKVLFPLQLKKTAGSFMQATSHLLFNVPNITQQL